MDTSSGLQFPSIVLWDVAFEMSAITLPPLPECASCLTHHEMDPSPLCGLDLVNLETNRMWQVLEGLLKAPHWQTFSFFLDFLKHSLLGNSFQNTHAEATGRSCSWQLAMAGSNLIFSSSILSFLHSQAFQVTPVSAAF